MSLLHGFEFIQQQEIKELKSEASLLRHCKTGAEMLSVSNQDQNKVFGIVFKTPPSDSKGTAHIIEHSVLCGSGKYPVKEPFVELLKGSLQTFLNAFTYPDKTCYPVASQNLKDFYNLVDVYLDAVFYPLLTPMIFQQEAWHYELENMEAPLVCKGVVFNEMKGVYSSPDSLLNHYSMQCLFPDSIYRFDSGGNPQKIPDLTYEQFKSFHSSFYHPSNCRIFFSGDDPVDERCCIINQYLEKFNPAQTHVSVPLQQGLTTLPESMIKTYPCPADVRETDKKSFVTINWLLGPTTDPDLNMTLTVLEYILLGMPGSPLKKALLDCGLGEGIAGVGLENELQQLFFSTGLKGMACSDAQRMKAVVVDTLSQLVSSGIDPETIDAAINRIEFSLRENNTGSFPRGLMVMLRALTSWLYDGNPFELICFEATLDRMKKNLAADKRFFEKTIEKFLLNNPHCSMVVLKPDPQKAAEDEQEERDELSRIKSSMTEAQLQEVVFNTKALNDYQKKPDTPSALATIPKLKLSEIAAGNSLIPLERSCMDSCSVFYHDIFTNNILYLDIGLNIRMLPGKYLSYIPLFARALLEAGTRHFDVVGISQLISQKTGGIKPSVFTSTVRGSGKPSAWLFLRGKAVCDKAVDLLDIFREILLCPMLDNKDRFRQIILEEKTRQEQSLIPHGHNIINLRMCSHFSKAQWADEQMHGLSFLMFLRNLEKTVDTDWETILGHLEDVRKLLIRQSSMIVNATVDEKSWIKIKPVVEKFAGEFPDEEHSPPEWLPENLQKHEGLIAPCKVNYVGKGFNLYETQYQYSGAIHVIIHFLRTSWLWEKVRVMGGAYGAICRFDKFAGGFSMVSYRDPNITDTLGVFDQTADFISGIDIAAGEVEKSIIGAIGDVDAPMLPDTMGFVSLQRYLCGYTEVERQKMRDEILSATKHDFNIFGSFLQEIKERGIIKVLGSETSVVQANSENKNLLKLINVF